EHRGDVAVDRLNRDADAVVTPFLTLAHLRVFARIKKTRVRIERAEHAADRTVDKAIGFHLVDVVRLNRIERSGECAVVFGNLVVGRERTASEEPANEGGNEDREDDGGKRTVASH